MSAVELIRNTAEHGRNSQRSATTDARRELLLRLESAKQADQRRRDLQMRLSAVKADAAAIEREIQQGAEEAGSVGRLEAQLRRGAPQPARAFEAWLQSEIRRLNSGPGTRSAQIALARHIAVLNRIDYALMAIDNEQAEARAAELRAELDNEGGSAA